MEERSPLLTLGSRMETMSPDSDAITSTAADAVAATLDLLLTEKAALDELDGSGLAPNCDAPGTYVHDH